MKVNVEKYANIARKMPKKVYVIAGGVMASAILTKTLHGRLSIRRSMSVPNAAELIENEKYNPGFVLIDIRPASEYEKEHLDLAFNIDYSVETFARSASKLDRSKKYLVYGKDSRSSIQAVRVMRKLGFRSVYYLRDTYEALRDYDKEYGET